MGNQPTPYAPSLPLPEGGYIRTFEAEIDNLVNSTIRVRGLLSDHRCALAYEWELRLPDYVILHASARHLSGESTLLSPALLDRCTAIQGVCASQGFTTTMRHTLGTLPGHHEHLMLAIEMARVSLQGFTVPAGDHERFQSVAAGVPPGPSRVARMAWERDRVDWPMICNSCYTYRDESAALFAERAVKCFDLDTIAPAPGQKRFFQRKKRMHIAERPPDQHRTPGFSCSHEMRDTFHDMRVAFDIEADGTVHDAASQWARLPFQGLCEDAHLGTSGLKGKKLGKDYMRLLSDHVGGRSGCSHLFDLSVDCVRFFDWRD